MSIFILLMKKFLLLPLLFPLFSGAQGPLRVEIEARSDADNYYIIPAGNAGLVLFNETWDNSQRGRKMLSFTMFNSDFLEVWTKTFPVLSGLSYVKHDVADGHLYVLLSESGRAANFQILSLDYSSGEIMSNPGKMPQKTAIEDFNVINGMAYIGGRTLPTTGQILGRSCLIYMACGIPLFFGGMEFKYQPVLYVADVSQGGRSVPILLKYAGSAMVGDIARNEKTKNAEILLLNRPKKDVFKMEIREYSGTEPGGVTKVSPNGNNELLSGKVMPLSDNGKVLIGTYGAPIKSKSAGERMNRAMGRTSAVTFANGLYISKFNNGEQEYLFYYPFSKFESFWSKIQGHSPGKKYDNRLESRLGYQLLVHDIIEKNDAYTVVAEAYFPEYEQRVEYYYDAQGNMQHRTNSVFVGYRYTHAIIAGFSKEGEKLWDNSFEIMDILTFNLKERVKVLLEGDNIVLAYSHNGLIKSKVIAEGQVIDGKQSTAIETNYPNDVVKSSWGSDMEFWYDNFFLTWGFQRINNKTDRKDSGKTKRTVFYFNKIEFQ